MAASRPLPYWAALLLLLPLLAPAWAQSVGASAPDTAAGDAQLLLAFRSTFANGAEVLTDWAGDSPCSPKWTGITCFSGRVTGM